MNYTDKFGVIYNDRPEISLQRCNKSISGTLSVQEGTEYICMSAFAGCKNLNGIIIPKSVKKIGENAFHECENLHEVYFQGTLEDWLSIEFENAGSAPCQLGAKLFIDNKLVDELVIPETVSKVQNFAFTGVSSITSVVIPPHVTSLGEGAFGECHNLKCAMVECSTTISPSLFYACKSLNKVFLNDDIRAISIRAFSHCKSLEAVILPKSLLHIENFAFYGCDSMESISIHRNLSTVGDAAFGGCSCLSLVKYEGTLEEWMRISFFDFSTSPCFHGAVLYIDGKKLEELVVPSSISIIDAYFNGCTSLKKVTIPGTVKLINEMAFANCPNLSSVTIMDGVEEIAERAFASCDKLEHLFLPVTVEKIAPYFAINSTNMQVYCEGEPKEDWEFLWDRLSTGPSGSDLPVSYNVPRWWYDKFIANQT